MIVGSCGKKGVQIMRGRSIPSRITPVPLAKMEKKNDQDRTHVKRNIKCEIHEREQKCATALQKGKDAPTVRFEFEYRVPDSTKIRGGQTASYEMRQGHSGGEPEKTGTPATANCKLIAGDRSPRSLHVGGEKGTRKKNIFKKARRRVKGSIKKDGTAYES